MKNSKLYLLFMGLTLVFAQLNGQYRKHLIALYPFNGNTVDESPNTNDGTNNGATLTTDRKGNPSSAYSFNGTSSYIDCGNNSSLNQAFTGLTVACWIFMDRDGNSEQHILGKWANTSAGDQVCLRMISQKFYFFIANPSTSTGLWGGTKDTVSMGAWHFLTGTWSNSGEHKIYVDGKLANKFTPSGLTTINTTSAINLFIGRQPTPNTHYRYFKGKMDDISIYNSVLDSTTIDSVMKETWNTAGIKTETLAKEARIYPNPTRDIIKVESAATPVELNLTDLSGKLIKTISGAEMNIAELKQGVYLLQISYADRSKQITRILKE